MAASGPLRFGELAGRARTTRLTSESARKYYVTNPKHAQVHMNVASFLPITGTPLQPTDPESSAGLCGKNKFHAALSIFCTQTRAFVQCGENRPCRLIKD